MAADEDNKEQVLKECEQTEEVMKDKQNQVKRKNYWVLLKIDLHLLVLQWGCFICLCPTLTWIWENIRVFSFSFFFFASSIQDWQEESHFYSFSYITHINCIFTSSHFFDMHLEVKSFVNNYMIRPKMEWRLCCKLPELYCGKKKIFNCPGLTYVHNYGAI